NTFGEVTADDHLKERGYWMEETHPVAGKLTYPGAPFKLAEGGFVQRRPAPTLGQHNYEIFCGRLNLSPKDLTHLSADAVIPISTGQQSATQPLSRPIENHNRRNNRLPLNGLRVIDMTV